MIDIPTDAMPPFLLSPSLFVLDDRPFVVQNRIAAFETDSFGRATTAAALAVYSRLMDDLTSLFASIN